MIEHDLAGRNARCESGKALDSCRRQIKIGEISRRQDFGGREQVRQSLGEASYARLGRCDGQRLTRASPVLAPHRAGTGPLVKYRCPVPALALLSVPRACGYQFPGVGCQ